MEGNNLNNNQEKEINQEKIDETKGDSKEKKLDETKGDNKEGEIEKKEEENKEEEKQIDKPKMANELEKLIDYKYNDNGELVHKKTGKKCDRLGKQESRI